MSIRLSQLEQLQDPIEAAQAAGLRYVAQDLRGISRERSGKAFRYRDKAGKTIHDRQVLARIKALAIPPAWTNVWICADPNGHLQATGRDDRGRKQHRYHRRWREVRDETKYTRMIAFAKVLPRIRQRVKKDLRLPGLPRNKVLATVVRLLEVSLIRVGNDEYARDNDSFGLTTMRNRHVDVNGARLEFHFRGKSGKWHQVDIRDRRLAKIVKSCQDLPGQELFQYVDEQGQRLDVRSGDVNDYLREITGKDFTAKDFRTWAGTVLGAMALMDFEEFQSQTQARKNIARAIESVAERLGNTPAVCRKCYMHPEVINAYMGGALTRILDSAVEKLSKGGLRGLRSDEAAVLSLLRIRAAAEARQTQSVPKLLRRSLAVAKKRQRVARKHRGLQARRYNTTRGRVGGHEMLSKAN